MSKHIQILLVALLVARLVAGLGIGAETNSIDPAKIIADFSTLINLLADQGALHNDGELDGRLRLAVCRAIDPKAEILDQAAAKHRQEEESGIFFGIGAQVEIADRYPRVLQVLPEGPAAAAGLPPGALIEKIDGTNTLDMTIGDVIALLRGHRDQPVTLEYRLPGATAAPDTTVSANTDTNIPPEHTEANVDQTAQSYTIKLKRSLMQMPKTGITEEWPLQLAYMKINGIYDGSGSYAVKQLQDWATQNIAGVILDLRSAGGADLPSVAEIGSLFAQEGQPLFRVIAADNREPVTYSSNKSSPLPVPVMALIDADTSGAAACLAAVLRNARGAMLIGAACPHDLVVRTPVPLADGRVLFIATQQIELLPPTELPPMLTPDVQIPAGVSLPPPPESKKTDDIFVQITDQERQERALTERIGQDAVLRRAADILLGLKALGIKAD